MNRTMNLTLLGGLHTYQDTLEFMQTAYSEAIDAVAALIGEKGILSGVEEAGGNVTAGWIVYNGQLLPLVGGLKTDHIDIETIVTDEQFEDGTQKPFYTSKRLRLVTISTGTSFPFTELRRPDKIKNVWQKYDIKEIDCDAAYVTANFDSTGLGMNERKGWAICNGQNGTKNRKGRASVMIDDAQTEFNELGKQGGSKTHTLIIAEMPAHKHTFDSSGDGATDNHPTNRYGAWKQNPDYSGTYDPHMNTTGGGQAHNNLQPYHVTLFIQKIID